jgi:hypothetical protein
LEEKEAREASNFVEVKLKNLDDLKPTSALAAGEAKMRLEDVPQPNQIVAKTKVK